MAAIKLVLDGVPEKNDNRNDSELSAQSILASVEKLSPEEKLQTEQFAAMIDLHKTDIVTSYGATIQKQSANIASKTLDGVRSSSTGDISQLLINLVEALDSMEGGKSSLFGSFLRGSRTEAERERLSRENAEATLDRIEKQLLGHKLVLQKDMILLDALYEENMETYKALTMYIRAAEIALDRARNGELVSLRSQADLTGSAEDAMNVEVFSQMCDQFEIQIENLRLTRTICLQSAPQINMIRRNDREMMIKLQSSIVNTIPLWRKKIAMSAAMDNSLKAAQASSSMDELTGRMLREQASRFRRSIAQTAQAAQSSPFDAQTIEFVNREITGAVEDYIAVQRKGALDRIGAVNVMAESERRLSSAVSFPRF